MKKYLKEIVITFLQLLLFYIFPIFIKPSFEMGMVFLIIITTFMLSLMIGILSVNKIKYLYPIFTAIIFIPSVFIYYNSSALIHAIWYLFIASIGILLGIIIKKVIKVKI